MPSPPLPSTVKSSPPRPMQSTEPPEDIPVAMRDAPVQSQTKAKSPYLLVWIVSGAIGAIALTVLSTTLWILNNPKTNTATSDPNSSAPTTAPNGDPAAIATDPTLNPTDPATPNSDGSLLGHKPYDEAPPETLVPILADGSLKLREPAAKAWFALSEEARKAGHSLIVLSAFRSKEDQEYLFFEVQRQRGQNPSTRAEVSAPPGYSEHHTGYALDIGDYSNQETYLNQSFENTAAFQWLKENAGFYGFEMSFPPDNAQGISYEPWHWRFVGDQDSLETFYRDQPPPASPSTPSSP
ncbi:MAG: M15 family metallopeptidase [Prochlorothrix sp.]